MAEKPTLQIPAGARVPATQIIPQHALIGDVVAHESAHLDGHLVARDSSPHPPGVLVASTAGMSVRPHHSRADAVTQSVRQGVLWSRNFVPVHTQQPTLPLASGASVVERLMINT